MDMNNCRRGLTSFNEYTKARVITRRLPLIEEKVRSSPQDNRLFRFSRLMEVVDQLPETPIAFSTQMNPT
jgi:hypothetical protein